MEFSKNADFEDCENKKTDKNDATCEEAVVLDCQLIWKFWKLEIGFSVEFKNEIRSGITNFLVCYIQNMHLCSLTIDSWHDDVINWWLEARFKSKFGHDFVVHDIPIVFSFFKVKIVVISNDCVGAFKACRNQINCSFIVGWNDYIVSTMFPLFNSFVLPTVRKFVFFLLQKYFWFILLEFACQIKISTLFWICAILSDSMI